MAETVALSALFLGLIGLLFEHDKVLKILSKIPFKELRGVFIYATLRIFELTGEALAVVAVIALFFASFTVVGDFATAVGTLLFGIMLIYAIAVVRWLAKKGRIDA